MAIFGIRARHAPAPVEVPASMIEQAPGEPEIDSTPRHSTDPLRLPDRIDPWSDWAVQPGVFPEIGQVVHIWDPSNGTCAAGLVYRVTGSWEPGVVDPRILVTVPSSHVAEPFVHSSAQPRINPYQAYDHYPKSSWHRAAECRGGR